MAMMATPRGGGMRRQQRRAPPPPSGLNILRWSSKKLIRTMLITLAFIALVPPLFFVFKLKSFRQAQLRKCGWLNSPPLVCAHGGDSTSAFPNTMAAYRAALNAQVDCIEIDVSRSSDGVLLALHDSAYLETVLLRLDTTAQKSPNYQSAKFHDANVPTIEEALKLVANSVREVVLDIKVGPPSFEKGLAEDILAVVERVQCRNCVVWAKSDTIARDMIRLSSDVTVGYIVMMDYATGVMTNLLRMRDARVVGVYHPLVDEKLVRVLHRRNKKVYAWTVDDIKSMENMVQEHVDAIVTGNPTTLQGLMQDTRRQCLEHGFSLSE